MNDDILSVAVIGLGAFGRHTLEALRSCESVRIVGVADRDGRLAKRIGGQIGTTHYTDNRQLLLSTRPRAVFLATPPMCAPELLETCAELGIAVWKEAPLARNLGEAAAMVRRFADTALPLAVGTQRRFAETYCHAHESLGRAGGVFLARAHYLFNWGPELHWRADRQSAGGGALLELGYHLVDLLVWMLGPPEDVYGLAACEVPRENANRHAGPHDTDDTALAILRYKDQAMASITASRVTGPASEELVLHGRGGSLAVNSETCTLRNSTGDVLDHLRADAPPLDTFRRQVEAFLHAVREGGNNAPYPCSAAQNLLNHAVIDAVYLSSRTGQPERPLDQLRLHGLQLKDCLKHHPPNKNG